MVELKQPVSLHSAVLRLHHQLHFGASRVDSLHLLMQVLKASEHVWPAGAASARGRADIAAIAIASRSAFTAQPCNRYLIKNASLFSFPAFISSRIQRGVAPRPAHVSFGFFLLRYFGATLRP